MPSGKHAPTRLSTYATVHHNVLDQFVREGFVDAGHDLDFTATEAGFLLRRRTSSCGRPSARSSAAWS